VAGAGGDRVLIEVGAAIAGEDDRRRGRGAGGADEPAAGALVVVTFTARRTDGRADASSFGAAGR
jgi:hypothetical protein